MLYNICGLFLILRLVRVQQKVPEYAGRKETANPSQEATLVLFDDYAVFDKPNFYIGQVCRIVHKGKDFRKPVLLSDPRAPDIIVTLDSYHSNQDSVYVKGAGIRTARLPDIISHVNLSLVDNGFEMNGDESRVIMSCVETLPTKT